MTNTALTTDVHTDHHHIRADEDAVLHIVATLGCGSSSAPRRAPLTVVFVLDVSGSMAGEPLAQTKRATTRLLSSLGPDDRAAVVAFSSAGELVAPMRACDERGRRDLIRDVGRLSAKTATNLQAGLEVAQANLPPRRTGERQLLLLLSDGQPTTGYVTPRTLAAVVRQMRPEVGVSALGFGPDHDETILGAIAEAGGGRYFFVADPNLCEPQFAEALGAQSDVAVERIRVDVSTARGVDVLGVLGASHHLTSDGTTIDVPDLLAERTHQIAIRLRVARSDVGSRPLADLVVSHRPAGHDEDVVTTHHVEQDVRRPSSQIDLDVVRDVLVLRCEVERLEARALAEDGRPADAAVRLRTAATVIEALPGFVANDGSALAEAHDQLSDDADFFEQRPDLETVRAFRRGQAFNVGGAVEAGAYQPNNDFARALVDDAAGPLPRAVLYDVESQSTFKLARSRIIIGRSRTCDVTVPSAKVSRQSAELIAVEGRFWLQDLGSANGVYMNGAKVAQHALRSGDSFVIGDRRFQYLED